MIQIGFDPVARAIQQPPRLFRRRQRALGVGGVGMHRGLIEELRGPKPVQIGQVGGHVDAFRGGEEAAEHGVTLGICALHRVARVTAS